MTWSFHDKTQSSLLTFISETLKEKALHTGVRLAVVENFTNNVLHSSQNGVRREKEC
jgi:hypothetical protein